MMKIYEKKPIWVSLIVLTLIITVSPLWLNQNLALTDYPNHLVRFHIMENLSSSPDLANIYKIRSGFYPYWGMFSIMKIFQPLFGLEIAGKIFLSCSLLTPVIGTALLSKAVTGRVSPVSLLAASFTYSTIFAWGFANFQLGLGLSLILFALWVAMGERITAIKVCLFAVLALLLLCVHMISVALLGLLIGFWHLYPVFKSRKITLDTIKTYALIALVFLPSFCLIIAIPRKDLGDVPTVFGLLQRKDVFTSAFSFQNNTPTMFLAIALIIALIYFRDKGVFKPNARLVFVAISLSILAFIIPVTIMDVAYLHIRLPLIIAFVFMSAWTFHAHKLSRIAVCVLALLCVLRIGIINQLLHQDSQKIAEYRASLSKLPKGINILPVMDLAASRRIDFWTYVKNIHLTSYSIIEGNAFYPLMFPMYEVGYTPAYDKLSVPQGFPLLSETWIEKPKQIYGHDWQKNYDYIAYVHYGAEMKLPDYVDIIDNQSWFSILKNNSPERLNKPKDAP